MWLSRWSLALVLLVGCRGEANREAPTEVVAVHRSAVTTDPTAAAWQDAPEYRATLLLQDMVEPRLLAPSTPEVKVRAITDGQRLALRLEWSDAGPNDVPGPAMFSDACAVQVPVAAGADVTAPQMGEPGRPVEITYWRASWQAIVDGRPDTIQALHPAAAVDAYPFDAASLAPGSPDQVAMAKRYAPARAVGNDLAGPRVQPVQDLLGEGPGTLRPAEHARSEGRGNRTASGWSVVLVRPLPDGSSGGVPREIAFAVWAGENGEVGARKMRTGWVPLRIEVAP
ncbi:MAG TPA: ethylbenzene dehydrogenase-related protein [Candidatus Binatia bacterium]|nr:ethylbenzene dehydrogenase-related protein [Candidatus Binatia bacterium]